MGANLMRDEVGVREEVLAGDLALPPRAPVVEAEEQRVERLVGAGRRIVALEERISIGELRLPVDVTRVDRRPVSSTRWSRAHRRFARRRTRIRTTGPAGPAAALCTPHVEDVETVTARSDFFVREASCRWRRSWCSRRVTRSCHRVGACRCRFRRARLYRDRRIRRGADPVSRARWPQTRKLARVGPVAPRLPPSAAPSQRRNPWPSRYWVRPMVTSTWFSLEPMDLPDRQPMVRLRSERRDVGPIQLGMDP